MCKSSSHPDNVLRKGLPIRTETLVDLPNENSTASFCALFTIGETGFPTPVVHFLLEDNQFSDLRLLKSFGSN
jgi:hypothetical protein